MTCAVDSPAAWHAARIELDLILAVLAPEAVHLDDAGHGPQRGRHLPVEDLLLLHQRERVVLDGKLEDLPEPARVRAHLGPAVASRDRLLRLAHAFVHCWRAK
jgi:hypothetical protein